MNCFREIKYHANILAVHCNVINAKSAKLNSKEITFMGKTQNIIHTKYKAFTVFDKINQAVEGKKLENLSLLPLRGVWQTDLLSGI